ncbi:MAG: alpha/beta fold hydrolase [Chloroflexota bacterium]
MQSKPAIPMPIKILRRILRIVGSVSPEIAGYIVFKLFKTPVKRMKKTLPLNPVQHTFTHNKRVLTGYEWQGSGQRILLVHGWESSPARFNKIIERLVGQGYHVFAMDAPAHGYSEGWQTDPLDYGDALHAFIETIGQVDTVLAHSFGGVSLMNMLDRYPDVQPERVVLIGSIDSPQQAVDFFTNVFQLLPAVSQEMGRRMAEFAGGSLDDVSATQIAKSRTEDVLIIHDIEDNIVPVIAGRSIAGAWHNAEYIETDGLGHRRILNDDDVIAHILAFLKERQFALA